MENFVDSEYKIHLTVAKAGLLYLLQLADTPLLPFTMDRYSDVIHRGVISLNKTMMESYGVRKADADKGSYIYIKVARFCLIIRNRVYKNLVLIALLKP